MSFYDAMKLLNRAENSGTMTSAFLEGPRKTLARARKLETSYLLLTFSLSAIPPGLRSIIHPDLLVAPGCQELSRPGYGPYPSGGVGQGLDKGVALRVRAPKQTSTES